MLYGIEGILNGKLFGNGEGGSSGGVTLHALTNPAGADQILEGYEAVDGSGNKLTGTHVCESGGGGVGVAPRIDHVDGGVSYGEFVFSTDQTVVAGGSIRVTDLNSFNLYDNAGEKLSPSGAGYGYIYGHPEITVKQAYSAKNGKYFEALWNSSTTDFTFKAGETYTLVFLYHA